MATKKKMLQAAAGQAGGAGLDITDVFSTYLYDGTGSAQTITNGIDLAGEGGLVWSKERGVTSNHGLYDTERGATKRLASNETGAEETVATSLTSFNSDGFSIGSGSINDSGRIYASWTFRKAPKFFDVVTWTGDGVSGRTITHNLGSTPGFAVIKRTSDTSDWWVYHRSAGATLELNTTGAAASTNNYDGAAYTWTDTQFTVGAGVVGQNSVNANNSTYVAYLFAHNDGDGEFGPSGDQDIIKCGSYTGTGVAGNEIDLGFEPQWLLIKESSGPNRWLLFDNMRGLPSSDTGLQLLRPNESAAEVDFNTGFTGQPGVQVTSTGFSCRSGDGSINSNGATYIYMAIRRGPLAPPESGTEVFAVDTGSTNDPAFDSGFPVDFAILTETDTNTDNDVATRLLGTDGLRTNSTAAAVGPFSDFKFDFMDGWNTAGYGTNTVSWMWKRAPGFFDVVAYTGNGTAGRTVSHNLGVAPEMMWVKSRGAARLWAVYNSASGPTKWLRLDSTNAETTSNIMWNDTSPTDSVFSVGSSTAVNNSGENYIAYLFASLAGVSKVGSYTGNGSSQTIDCGFTSGARFVLIKSTTESRSWCVFDTARGIVAGNDPVLYLQETSAEVTSIDWIDPHPSGFEIVTSQGNINGNGQNYIFYAIA